MWLLCVNTGAIVFTMSEVKVTREKQNIVVILGVLVSFYTRNRSQSGSMGSVESPPTLSDWK